MVRVTISLNFSFNLKLYLQILKFEEIMNSKNNNENVHLKKRSMHLENLIFEHLEKMKATY